ncbi:hypothetical protein FBY58_0188 [Zymomonas mobilis]|uniref:Uncharacterized protein n=1 Tax=Zymomonas mobilis TaxID=542 RepID=A0A542VZ95_ZYMMB|nr:hypothetical protein FBY58_0188 [Zymomonas mobilis]
MEKSWQQHKSRNKRYPLNQALIFMLLMNIVNTATKESTHFWSPRFIAMIVLGYLTMVPTLKNLSGTKHPVLTFFITSCALIIIAILAKYIAIQLS